MRLHRNVCRVDRERFHGWMVHVMRKRMYWKYFWDRHHGGRKGALAKALRYRDWLEAKLPPAARIQRTNLRNRTGMVGLYRGVHWRKDGSPYYYYAGTWVDASRRTRSRSFSVDKYGKAKARRLAIAARREAVARILEERRRLGPGLPRARRRSGRH